MRTIKEIRADMRALKAEMKAAGIRVQCTMNRLELPNFRANMRLEALKLELMKSEAAAPKLGRTLSTGGV